MPRHRWLTVATALALGLAMATDALAAAPLDQLKAQIDRVLRTLEDPELRQEGKAQERRTAVRNIANDFFDYGETARRSLARHWAPRTPVEREEFVQLFGDLLERSYISRIELYAGEKIAFVGDSVDGDQAVVRTRIITKSGSDVPIDYRMHRKDDRWLVYDVMVEGISLVSSYRTQFNKIIQSSSFQELVRKLRIKQEEFLGEERQKRT
ncbi:MAG: MlaC/ttg2D family ABC transporter substrate-binding protein [Candidatus Rokuibacteriota bacterium]